MDLRGFTGHNHHLYFSEAFSGVDVIGSTMLRLLAIVVLGRLFRTSMEIVKGLRWLIFRWYHVLYSPGCHRCMYRQSLQLHVTLYSGQCYLPF
jgi:hypothetical protein